jgi:hypothetical protein
MLGSLGLAVLGCGRRSGEFPGLPKTFYDAGMGTFRQFCDPAALMLQVQKLPAAGPEKPRKSLNYCLFCLISVRGLPGLAFPFAGGAWAPL